MPLAQCSYGLAKSKWDNENDSIEEVERMPYICWGSPENENYFLEDRKTCKSLMNDRIPLDEAMHLGEVLVATGA